MSNNSTWQEGRRVGPSEGRWNKKWVVGCLSHQEPVWAPRILCVVESQGGEGFCLTCWTEKGGTSQVDFFSPLQDRQKVHTASWMLNAELHGYLSTHQMYALCKTLQSQQQPLQQLLRNARGQRGVMQRLAALGRGLSLRCLGRTLEL